MWSIIFRLHRLLWSGGARYSWWILLMVRVSQYRCRAHAGERPRPEQYQHTAIALVRAGTFGIRDLRGAKLLAPGFVLLGNAGEPYEAFHEQDGGDRCLVLDFSTDQIETIADSKQPFRRSVLPPSPRIEALRKLIEERLGEPRLAIEELALELAGRVLAESGRTIRPTDGGRAARERVLAAIHLMEQSATEPLGLDELAAAGRLSPFHFLRLFKRETGDTPYRFLVRIRLRRAIELLRDTDRAVTEVAFEVGFGDLSNFINSFRREVGVS